MLIVDDDDDDDDAAKAEATRNVRVDGDSSLVVKLDISHTQDERHVEVIENDDDAPLPDSQIAALFPMLELSKYDITAPAPLTRSGELFESDAIDNSKTTNKTIELIENDAPLPSQEEMNDARNKKKIEDTEQGSRSNFCTPIEDLQEEHNYVSSQQQNFLPTRRQISPSIATEPVDEPSFPVIPSIQPNSLASIIQHEYSPQNAATEWSGESSFSVIRREADTSVSIHSNPMLLASSEDSNSIQSAPLYTVIDATVVDDLVYDAIPYHACWLSRRTLCFVLVGLVSASIVSTIAYFVDKKKKYSNGGVNQKTHQASLWQQQGETITADVGVGHLGASVVLSADGSILVIGANGYAAHGFEDGPGHVKLYRFHNGSSWEQIGQDIKGNRTGDTFGYSLDLSADGKTLAIGAPARMFEEKDGMPGYVRVYSINEGDDASISWTSIGQIVGDAPADYFGGSVSVSADGTTLAVGGYGNDGNGSNSGHTRLYQISGSGLTQLGDDINGEAIEDSTGFDVSLSADGRTVAISSPWNSGIGKVMIFSFDSTESSWKQVGKDIFGDLLNDCFGWSVALSADGQTVGVGAPAEGMTDDPGGGYVRVYHFEDDDWQKIGNDISGDKFGGAFGGELSISDDGKTIAIGNYHGDGKALGSGYVKVYRINDYESDWEQFGKTIEGETSFGGFGSSISFTADGRTVAIGSPFSNYKGGNVRVFSIAN